MEKRLQTLLEKVKIEVKELDDELEEKNNYISPKKAVDFSKCIPTIEKNFYRELSPMLTIRFAHMGGWEDATHGDWLDTSEMEIFWNDAENTERLESIKRNIIASIDNWINDAGALFKENRISVFAGSSYTYERIYLIWFDDIEEPELWVYDSNGISRYLNLEENLNAYLDDDLSASDSNWILEYKKLDAYTRKC